MWLIAGSDDDVHGHVDEPSVGVLLSWLINNDNNDDDHDDNDDESHDNIPSENFKTQGLPPGWTSQPDMDPNQNSRSPQVQKQHLI